METALNETSLRLLNILRVFYKYYNSEVSCRILLRREEILSSSNSTHDQGVFHFTASKVDKDVVKRLSERRKKKLDHLVPNGYFQGVGTTGEELGGGGNDELSADARINQQKRLPP